MDTQTIITSVVSAVIIGTLAAIWGKLLTLLQDINTIRMGTRAGLLADITRIHDGAIKNGKINNDAMRIVHECYAQYHALGGNGYASALMDEIDALPTK